MPTDEERMEFLCNLNVSTIQKRFDDTYGCHWTWTIHAVNYCVSPAFDDLRDAVDWYMKKYPHLVPRKIKKEE